MNTNDANIKEDGNGHLDSCSEKNAEEKSASDLALFLYELYKQQTTAQGQKGSNEQPQNQSDGTLSRVV